MWGWGARGCSRASGSPWQVRASVTPPGPLQASSSGAARCSHVPRAPSLALGTATGGSRCRGQTRLAFAPFPDEPAHRGAAGQSVSEGMVGTDGPGRRPPARAQGAGGCAPRGRARLLRADGARGGSWAAGPGLVTWPQGPGTESPQCLRAMSSSVCRCVPDPHALLGSRKSHPVTALPGARRGALHIVPNETRRPHRGAAELALPWVTHPRPAGPPEGIAFGETNGERPPGFILRTRSSQ